MKNTFNRFVYSIAILGIFIYNLQFCLAREQEDASLTFAPEVPASADRREPAIVRVSLETKEIEGVLKENDSGVSTRYVFWTYNSHAPGPFIRLRQGDTLELTITNPEDSTHTHNIDLHAVNGPGGGGSITFVKPGETKTVSLKMLNAGLFVYHCATPPVLDHIANGMYGLILVEPAEGLPKVDKEFYVVESEFYTKEEFGFEGLATYDQNKASEDQPTYFVFNGKDGALTGEGVLNAKVGDKVRIFFGNGGPNEVASFHVIGEIFDKVYPEGSTSKAVERNVQTTLVPAGGSAIVEFKLEVPGTYTLVDHAFFKVGKGAFGQLSVSGDSAPQIYSSKD